MPAGTPGVQCCRCSLIINFLTHRHSGKVHELTARPPVGLTVSDSHCYIFVAGRADVAQDATLIRRLWHPTSRAWFPGGEDDGAQNDHRGALTI